MKFRFNGSGPIGKSGRRQIFAVEWRKDETRPYCEVGTFIEFWVEWTGVCWKREPRIFQSETWEL